MHRPRLICRYLGIRDYQPTWRKMREFTRSRNIDSDEIWLLEHPPVFTLGQAGKDEHLLAPAGIPVVRTDRGGQVTYHGPGQLVVYLLLDLRRLNLGVRQLVKLLERALIDLLADYQVRAATQQGAPGVYVEHRKIASLGLRVSRGCSFHGLSLNVDMDLQPFGSINPCGYPGLQVTQLADLRPGIRLAEVRQALLGHLIRHLGYNPHQIKHRGESGQQAPYTS